jgi:16S rRNA (uracil1498-N3)-methyltransferase
MKIEPVTELRALLTQTTGTRLVLATEIAGQNLLQAIESYETQDITLLVGPEGGWTSDELNVFVASGLTPVRLGATILRIETAAVAAAAIVQTALARSS